MDQQSGYGESSSKDKLGSDILVSGIITEVCPMRGCWLQVKDDNSDSSIRIKVTDGEIVFPLSAKGRNITAKGIFTKLELSKKQAKNWKHHLALEKGIDLDTSKIVLTSSDYYEYRLNSNSAKIFQIYIMMDVSVMELAMLRNMIIKTGKPLKKWIEIVKEENFVERKDIVRFLKDEYSVGHFYAQLIAKKSE